jgi:hypothetical protein
MLINTLAVTILAITLITGFIAIFFTSIGTLIILIGAVAFAWMTDFAHLSWQTLLVLLGVYLAGELIEFISSYIGSKTFGASNKAALGGVIGGLAGAVIGSLFFGLGILPGTFLGIFLGGLIVELNSDKSLKDSLLAGTGGVIGRVGAIAGKTVIGLIMIAIIIVDIT